MRSRTASQRLGDIHAASHVLMIGCMALVDFGASCRACSVSDHFRSHNRDHDFRRQSD